jgi:hypothetical protein
MPEPTDRSDHTDRVDADRAAGDDHEAEQREAARIYREVGAENPDPVTRREAVEGELEDEGLSEAGGHLGEHND